MARDEIAIDAAPAETCWSPLMVSFEIPERVSADLQMMSIWQQAFVQFEHKIEPHARKAALDWFAAWASAQIARASAQIAR